MKNVKTKVQKIWFLLSRALYSVTGIFLIQHIWFHELIIKISAYVEANPGLHQRHN